MPAHAAVRIHNDLPARKPGISHRPADYKASRRIDVILRVLIQQLRRDYRLDDVLLNIGMELIVRQLAPRVAVRELGMLRRDHNGIHANRPAFRVVLHRHLALAVRPKVRHLSVLANLRELLRQLVRQADRRRHQLRCLVGRIAEHHALIARAACVDTLRNVRGLLVQGGNDGAGVAVKTLQRVVVADLPDRLPHQRLYIQVGLAGDLTGDHH